MLEESLSRLLSLRQYRQDGVRRPSKPLLVLLALGRLRATGSSALTWDESEKPLAELIAEFGPPSRTAARQSAAYPFTHLRSDGVWSLSRDVPMDNIRPLDESPITGRLEVSLERALLEPGRLEMAARMIVESQFPMTVAPDVLTAVGLDPDVVLTGLPAQALKGTASQRRSSSWPASILAAWDHQCAFCGYDARLGKHVVGIEAAHVRWFNLGGPDELDNGMALCSLHHKLFDRGALGLTHDYQLIVSSAYSAGTDTGKRVYELHGRTLDPRPGTPVPRPEHVKWHSSEVFKGAQLAA